MSKLYYNNLVIYKLTESILISHKYMHILKILEIIKSISKIKISIYLLLIWVVNTSLIIKVSRKMVLLLL